MTAYSSTNSIGALRDRLERCHASLARLLGPEIEPFPVSEEVEKYRLFWRPEKPGLVLLAESHVYTTEGELKVKLLDYLSEDVPCAFVRFVYCLGYGENELLERRISPNPGTVHFWKIFHSCLHHVSQNEDFAPLLKAKSSAEERVQYKKSLLARMKAQNTWLVDASVVALYRSHGPKLRGALYKQVLKTSWKEYVQAAVQEAKPEGVLCIGFGVAEALEYELKQLGIPFGRLPQPNARLSSKEHLSIFQKYHQVAERPASVSDLCAKWSRELSS